MQIAGPWFSGHNSLLSRHSSQSCSVLFCFFASFLEITNILGMAMGIRFAGTIPRVSMISVSPPSLRYVSHHRHSSCPLCSAETDNRNELYVNFVFLLDSFFLAFRTYTISPIPDLNSYYHHQRVSRASLLHCLSFLLSFYLPFMLVLFSFSLCAIRTSFDSFLGCPLLFPLFCFRPFLSFWFRRLFGIVRNSRKCTIG